MVDENALSLLVMGWSPMVRNRLFFCINQRKIQGCTWLKHRAHMVIRKPRNIIFREKLSVTFRWIKVLCRSYEVTTYLRWKIVIASISTNPYTRDNTSSCNKSHTKFNDGVEGTDSYCQSKMFGPLPINTPEWKPHGAGLARNLVAMGSTPMVGDHLSRSKMLVFLLVNNIRTTVIDGKLQII